MAKKTRNEIAVGATVLVCLLLTIYIVVVLADWSRLFSPQQLVTVKLPYQVGLKGLAKGSPVVLGGSKIGEITDVRIGELDNQGELPVFFTMRFPQRYPLRNDCVLAPETTLLGGQASLVIRFLGAEGEVIEDGQTVALELEPSIADAMNQLKQELDPGYEDGMLARLKYEITREHTDSLLSHLLGTMAHVEAMSGTLQEQLEPNQQQTIMAKLHGILDHVTTISQALSEEVDRSDSRDEIAEGALLAKLHHALDSLDASLAEVREMVEENREPVTDTVASLKRTMGQVEETLPTLMSELEQALTKANHALTSAEESMETVRKLLAANSPSIDEIINNFTEVSVHTKLAMREIRRAPWRLLYQPSKDELYNQTLIDSAGDFVAGAERLNRASMRLEAMLKLAEVDRSIDPNDIVSMMAELESSFEQFSEAEEVFWKELK